MFSDCSGVKLDLKVGVAMNLGFPGNCPWVQLLFICLNLSGGRWVLRRCNMAPENQQMPPLRYCGPSGAGALMKVICLVNECLKK